MPLLSDVKETKKIVEVQIEEQTPKINDQNVFNPDDRPMLAEYICCSNEPKKQLICD